MTATPSEPVSNLEEFQKTEDPRFLQDEADRLMGIVLPPEHDASYAAARKAALDGWLALFAAIFGALDPKFDPEDRPMMQVEPPPVNGVKYPPGIDPSALPDPAARAEYARRIDENEKRIRRYNVQTKLHRLDEKLRPILAAFFQNAYPAPEDRPEITAAIQAHIADPARAAELRKLAGP